MRVLIVGATDMELAAVTTHFQDMSENGARTRRYRRAGHEIDALTAGVGMVAVAAWCSHVLARQPYDLALNFGLCGSFDRTLEPGSVVHVVSDRIAELGAEDNEEFLTIQELNLLGADEFPFTRGQLVNHAPPTNAALRGLPPVAGITVNTVHGCERTIDSVVRRFAPQVESMEGAAFMYACAIKGLPFAQVRAVSNFVERRNRQAWKIADATRSLADASLRILDGL
jgi:futalosine hydrolase